MSVKSAFCNHASAIAPQFAHRFSPFRPLVLTAGLKRDCNTIALPRSSTFLTVNARGSVISLASGILS